MSELQLIFRPISELKDHIHKMDDGDLCMFFLKDDSFVCCTYLRGKWLLQTAPDMYITFNPDDAKEWAARKGIGKCD